MMPKSTFVPPLLLYLLPTCMVLVCSLRCAFLKESDSDRIVGKDASNL